MVMSVSVCLSVRVFFYVRNHISGTVRPIFVIFLCMYVTYGRGSVLF